MRILMIALSLCQLFYAQLSYGAERHQEVVVADPFIELHTGPGRGYPVFQVIERGDEVALLKRRTEWFLVRTPAGREGWVPRAQLERTLEPTGERKRFRDPTLNDYAESRWEVGAMYGDFGGANVISTYGSYSLTPNLSLELWGSQVLGRFSNSYMLNANIVHLMFPEWRASPFFTLGTGVINTEPKATLVATEDRTDNLAHVGVGARAYLTRRFVLRAEYKSYVVFTSRDDNEEIREWKAGFSFFF
jgi:hypothetical protein